MPSQVKVAGAALIGGQPTRTPDGLRRPIFPSGFCTRPTTSIASSRARSLPVMQPTKYELVINRSAGLGDYLDI